MGRKQRSGGKLSRNWKRTTDVFLSEILSSVVSVMRTVKRNVHTKMNLRKVQKCSLQKTGYLKFEISRSSRFTLIASSCYLLLTDQQQRSRTSRFHVRLSKRNGYHVVYHMPLLDDGILSLEWLTRTKNQVTNFLFQTFNKYYTYTPNNKQH